MGLPRFRPPAPRRPMTGVNTMHKVQMRATRLTEHEIRTTMAAIHHCATRAREGVATELQIETLRSTMLIALEIERLSYVRGMAGHMEAATVAIKSVLNRGLETGTWQRTALHWYELDAITCALDLHDHQLRQLTSAELSRATQRVMARMCSQGGGQVVNVSPADLGMEVPA